MDQSQVEIQPSEQTKQLRIRIDKPGGLSSFNIFCKELCSQEEGIKELTTSARFTLFSQRWAQLSDEERAIYKERAKSEPLSLSSKERQWKANLRKMKRLMDHQKELMPTTEGFFVMAHSARDEYFGGSEQGLKYLRENFHIVEGFVADPGVWAKSSSSKVTVKQIRDLFNEKYAAVAGKGKKMPYSMQNSFTVSGLPDGLQLRQPSRYGTKQLREIWDARDSIVILLLSS
ncbi:uncharacterized protein [Apostichopus japonicus]|uniref:uncharacterized protein n=1 Tax=Stichopus japonicus TaxID=307972 RepID=UPI003AB248C6